MRNISFLRALMPPTRQDVLTATLLQAGKWWYLSELANHIGRPISSFQREIDALAQAGILERRVDGRRAYIKANENSPIFPELRGLMEKTTGVVPLLIEEMARFKNKIKWAFIYGSMARSEENAASDVDVMLVGEISTMDVMPALRRVEKTIGRAINETIFSEIDFRHSIERKDHFLRAVLRGKKIMLKGPEDELDAIARHAKSA